MRDQTVRQIAHVSIGGSRVRIVLSNEYGTRPLTIGAAHIAVAGAGSSIVAGSDRPLTFGGRTSFTIPPGAPAVSDPVDLSVPALGNVAVSLYLPEITPLTTFHWEGVQTAYIAAGDQVGEPQIERAETTKARVLLSEIQVDAPLDGRATLRLAIQLRMALPPRPTPITAGQIFWRSGCSSAATLILPC